MSEEGVKISENNYKKNRGKFKPLSFPYVILIFLLAVTFAVTYIFYQSAKSKDSIRFKNQTMRLHYSIENKLRLYTALLRSGRGFVEGVPVLDRQAFSRFSNSLNFETDYKGVQGIGYTEFIQPDELENTEKRMRSEGAENYTVFPSGKRDFYVAVLYLEPFNEKTKAALGFDMSSEASRRGAIERARDTGEITMTGKIIPIQQTEADRIYGFVIYLPVYKTVGIPATVEERRKNIRGFVYCPFRATNFIEQVARDENKNDIGIKIFDNELRPENLLAQTTVENPGKYIEFNENPQIIQDDMTIGGRKWLIEFSTLPAFSEQSSVGWTPLILISGLTFSFLMFGMGLWEAKASEEVKKKALQLLESQKEREMLFENEKKARQAAEVANAAKDEFIAIVSHELKTPLNAIGGWTRILKSRDLPESTRETALHKVNKNLRLQTAMIEQLLNYSELLSNKINISEKDINFSKLFEETCSEIAPLFDEKKIEFVKINPDDDCLVSGDEEKLKMVIYNLFSNSLKFTPEGGRIETELKQRDKFIELTIKDDGRGISSDFLPFVFEQYRQADKPNIRDYGGLGLGLTMTGQIVRLHHGTIEAESAGINQGSTFTVKLPCAGTSQL